MKDIYEYGLMNDDEWDILPWVCYDSRPLFKIWVTSEEIAPFFIVQHHPYSISILLKINDTFKADVFQKAGLEGNSRDWERLAKKLIEKFEEENSGTNMFKFDSDEDVLEKVMYSTKP